MRINDPFKAGGVGVRSPFIGFPRLKVRSRGEKMAISTTDQQNLNRLSPRAFRSKLGDLIAQSQAGTLAYAEKTSSYSILTTDYFIAATGAGTKTLTLPSAATAGAGKRLEIAMVGAGTVTITPSGSDTIGGIAGSDNSMIQGERRVYTSDGVSNWIR